ncbi:MAG: succinate dehydrogenase cytochrome b subunit [Bacteroidales bacterium]|jgi:succinate dehydrogenase / fumarate reductase cytochrome b subunit|nr:succinate dehydrogenase cytochrome b subunit [Bacteroidales bacterium]
MSRFFTSSIGQKFFMSITGIFLMLFLVVHLSINSLLLVGDGELFNVAANFMGSNFIMKIIEPILALGLILHIIYAAYITLKNQKARPQNYKVLNRSKADWASKNMFILGGLVLIFLVIHLANFFWHIKFGTVDPISYNGGEEIHDIYSLVSGLFINWWWYDVIYILGAVFLFLHLTHGFWSAFQTLGWDNDKWIRRLKVVAYLYAIIIAGGFATIPVYFLIKYVV